MKPSNIDPAFFNFSSEDLNLQPIDSKGKEAIEIEKHKFRTHSNDEQAIERIKRNRDDDNHKVAIDKAYQLHEHKDRMFNWIISMSSYYLVIVMLIFFLAVFEFKNEFIDSNISYLAIPLLIVLPLFITRLIPIINQKINQISDNFVEPSILRQSQYARANDIIANKASSFNDNKKLADLDKLIAIQKYKFKKIATIIILGFAISLIYLILSKIINIRPSYQINSSIIIALITSTTGTIIALPAVVAKIIFDDKK